MSKLADGATLRVAIALALLCHGVACRSEQSRAESLEARAVSSAIRDLRAAPHDQKRAPLERLGKFPCQSPRACEAQQVCVQAYALHQKALETTSSLKEKLGEHPSSLPASSELLARAEQDLEHARRLMQECLRLETAMLVDVRP